MDHISDTVRNLRKRIQDLRDRLNLNEEMGCEPFVELIIPEKISENIDEEIKDETPPEPVKVSVDDLKARLTQNKSSSNPNPKPSKTKKDWVA